MRESLIFLYEMLLFMVPTFILVWGIYNISTLKSYNEPLRKYRSFFIISVLCIADMYIYGCFFRLKNIYDIGNDEDLILKQTAFVLFISICIYYVQRKNKKKKSLNDATIVEAVDEFPGGLGFADHNGIPILINKRMHRLIYEILNIPCIDVNYIWNALTEKSEKDKYKPKVFKNADDSDELYYKLKDGSIWCFKKSILAAGEESFVQIEAVDVSELAGVADEMAEDNEELKKQNKRIQQASFELEKVNREKERYFAKVAVHGEFGEYILWLRQFLRESLETGISDTDLKSLQERWNRAEDIVKGINTFSENEEIENELLKVGDLIGCKIFFPKKKPYKRYGNLYYSAVREALTNAVRHGKANELYVEIEEKWSYQRVTIWDNGSEKINFSSEGNGLTSLRKLMKKEDAKLKIITEDVFKMVITFPYKLGGDYDKCTYCG